MPETVDETFEKLLLDYFKKEEENYFSLIEKGLKPEDARSVLPNATATQIVITGTTSDWESFIKLRSDSHAQKEIRDISDTIKNYLKLN
jgi:thymidylate synthase (FAD)